MSFLQEYKLNTTQEFRRSILKKYIGDKQLVNYLSKITRLVKTKEDGRKIENDLIFVNEYLEELEKDAKAADIIDKVSTEELLKNESDDINSDGLQTPPELDEAMKINDFFGFEEPKKDNRSFVQKGIDALKNIPFFNTTKRSTKEISSVVVYLICLSLALFFRSSDTKRKMFIGLKDEKKNPFVSQYYEYIEELMNIDLNTNIKNFIQFLQQKAILTVSSKISSGKMLSTLTVYSITEILKNALKPIVFAVLSYTMDRSRKSAQKEYE